METVPTGKQIEKARKRAGVSTDDLAAAAGLSNRSHLRRIERGIIDPQAGTLRRIVKALDEFTAETAR